MPRTLTAEKANDFLEALHSQEPVAGREPASGLTHDFYRYPARFSPEFARTAIEAFSSRGDVILDPFTGGATTLVEALACGRMAIGADISPLAEFVATVKTTTLSENDLDAVARWAKELPKHLSLRNPPIRAHEWAEDGYQKDVPWRMRKMLEFMLAMVPKLKHRRQQRFVRCLTLRVGQWALDCKKHIPTVEEFREEILKYLDIFVEGMRAFRTQVLAKRLSDGRKPKATTLQLRASEMREQPGRKPNVVVTSPPYPGVYVLYHRWKIRGRIETPAPFWVADCRDGHGMAHYCFGDRKQNKLRQYFRGVRESFEGVHRVVSHNAIVIQVVAFAEPDWQVGEYLQAMEDAGFVEMMPNELGFAGCGRQWRNVPGRKWFTYLQGELATSKEVVLYHRPTPVSKPPRSRRASGSRAR